MRSDNLVLDDGRQVFSFNIYDDPRFGVDVHASLQSLHSEAPDIFYTEENGGHWVVTRHDHMAEILRDFDRFSSRHNRVPRLDEALILIPINLDRPAHTYYRKILNRHFGPIMIKRMESKIRTWAQTLIGAVASSGGCDFADAVGTLLPVSVFMELMGLPLDRLHEYRALVVEYFGDIPDARRLQLEGEISAAMREVIEARRADPRDDLVSKLIEEEVDGRRMSTAELEQLCNLLFQAGMDTVANFAAFFFNFLARRPDIQRSIRDDPACIPQILDEGFRMLGVVNNGRIATRDTVVGDQTIRAGEMVVCMLSIAGLDERQNADPDLFDPNRKGRAHLLFSHGIHLCVGHHLARMEMRVLLEEWFRLIPEFRPAEDSPPSYRAGMVMGMETLPLRWD